MADGTLAEDDSRESTTVPCNISASEGHYIDVQDMQTEETRDVYPVGHEIVASYNWRQDEGGIVVPGYAPILVAARVNQPFTLETQGQTPFPRQDQGLGGTMKPDDGLRMSGMEACFQAVELCSPGFDWGSVDIVTDANAVQDLLLSCGSPGNTQERQQEYGNFGDSTFFVYSTNNPGHDCCGGGRSRTIALSSLESCAVENYNPNGIAAPYRRILTNQEQGPGSEAAGRKLHLIEKLDLDGISLLVRVMVDACERSSAVPEFKPKVPTSTSQEEAPLASANAVTATAASFDIPQSLLNVFDGDDGMSSSVKPTTENDESGSISTAATATNECFLASGTATPNTAKCIIGGSLLRIDDRLIELATKNSRYGHELDWMRHFWRMALSGAETKIVGLHSFRKFNSGRGSKTLVLSKQEVKSIAERGASSSMVYLANVLREIVRTADKLLPLCPPIKMHGCVRQVAIVDFCHHPPPTGSGGRCIRVRVHHG